MNVEHAELRGDLEAAEQIIEVQAAVGWGTYRAGPEAFLRSVARREEQEGLRIFTLRLDGAVVGYCEVITRPRPALSLPPKTGYVPGIAIAPAHARKGLVAPFARWILARLRASGLERVVADIAVDNAASLNLNAGLGARFTGAAPDLVNAMAGGRPHVRVVLNTPKAAARAA